MLPAGATVRRAFDLMNSGRLRQAEEILRRHVQREPKDPSGLYVLAATLLSKGQHAQAAFFAAKANELSPNDHAILGVLGYSLASVGQTLAALDAFRKAVEIAPDEANAWVGLGVSLAAIDRTEEAIPAFQKAVALDPTDASAPKNLAVCYSRFGDANAAFKVLRAALQYAPRDEELLLQAAAMSNYADGLKAHETLAMHNSLARVIEARAGVPHIMHPKPLGNRSLRIALLSADFHDHSCSYFLEPLLNHFASPERASNARVSLACFSATRKPDAVTSRLRALGHAWYDVASLDDAACASLIRAESVNVLVECGGYTNGSRASVLARRAAPVQATYLGYPNTTALRECDFRIVDAVTDPVGNDGLCSERLIRLGPHFLCYSLRNPKDLAPVDPEPPATRAGQVTFASFNSPTKVGDACMEIWAGLLRQVPSARLLLKAKHDVSKSRLLQAFQARGISHERVSVLPLVENPRDHMALYNQVDVALDTFPYNGTTTTYEALSMGVPVVALAGDRHASRVSMSILHAVGVPELVATGTDAYVQLAATLASDVARLRHWRATLREQLIRSPACDQAAFARGFAAALHKAWEERVSSVK